MEAIYKQEKRIKNLEGDKKLGSTHASSHFPGTGLVTPKEIAVKEVHTLCLPSLDRFA